MLLITGSKINLIKLLIKQRCRADYTKNLRGIAYKENALNKKSLVWYSIIRGISGLAVYSDLRLFTGLADAAFTAW